MKKKLAFIILLCWGVMLQAQTILKFCVESDSTGACKTESQQFLISKDGGTISFLLKNDKGLGTNHIVYKLFKVDEDGKENYNSDLDQKVNPDWTFAWQDAVFPDPGTYIVKVYDIAGKESFICSKTVKLFRDH